jgi:hypothetical protein
MVHVLTNAPFARTLAIVQFILQVLALFLIFTGNARHWFKEETASNIDFVKPV